MQKVKRFQGSCSSKQQVPAGVRDAGETLSQSTIGPAKVQWDGGDRNADEHGSSSSSSNNNNININNIINDNEILLHNNNIIINNGSGNTAKSSSRENNNSEDSDPDVEDLANPSGVSARLTWGERYPPSSKLGTT